MTCQLLNLDRVPYPFAADTKESFFTDIALQRSFLT
jgi:hypothetical protein